MSNDEYQQQSYWKRSVGYLIHCKLGEIDVAFVWHPLFDAPIEEYKKSKEVTVTEF